MPFRFCPNYIKLFQLKCNAKWLKAVGGGNTFVSCAYMNLSLSRICLVYLRYKAAFFYNRCHTQQTNDTYMCLKYMYISVFFCKISALRSTSFFFFWNIKFIEFVQCHATRSKAVLSKRSRP